MKISFGNEFQSNSLIIIMNMHNTKELRHLHCCLAAPSNRENQTYREREMKANDAIMIHSSNSMFDDRPTN